jgi:hypothetical protein
MSTILKALRRLEDEKQARAMERDLREAVAAGGSAASPGASSRLRGRLIVLGVALVLGGVAAGIGLWSGASHRDGSLETVRAPSPPAPTPAARPAPGSTAGMAAPPPGAVVADENPRPGRTKAVARRAEAPSAPPQAAPSNLPSVAAAPLAPDFAVIDPPRVPETPPAQVVELDRPDASALTVTSTVWHPSAARRSAVVELEGEPGQRALREGDELGGFTIVEIEPAGVTFIRRGVRIHRRVGER